MTDDLPLPSLTSSSTAAPTHSLSSSSAGTQNANLPSSSLSSSYIVPPHSTSSVSNRVPPLPHSSPSKTLPPPSLSSSLTTRPKVDMHGSSHSVCSIEKTSVVSHLSSSDMIDDKVTHTMQPPSSLQKFSKPLSSTVVHTSHTEAASMSMSRTSLSPTHKISSVSNRPSLSPTRINTETPSHVSSVRGKQTHALGSSSSTHSHTVIPSSRDLSREFERDSLSGQTQERKEETMISLCCNQCDTRLLPLSVS